MRWLGRRLFGETHRSYVNGNTAYEDQLARIGATFGPLDWTFVKIGACGPGASWLNVHISPDDAMRKRHISCDSGRTGDAVHRRDGRSGPAVHVDTGVSDGPHRS